MSDPLVDPGEIAYARSGEVSVAYQIVGDGPIDVVFVSGFISHLELNWENEFYASPLRRLARRARVICIDKRGTGLSDRTLGYGSAAERADDIRAVMDEIGLERACLYGISEGGPLAILFAAAHAERVDKLALYGTFARLLPDAGYDPPPLPNVDDIVALIEKDWGNGSFFSRFVDAPDDAATRRAIARFERNASTPKVAGEVMRSNFTIDVRAILPTISAPTLIGHHLGDPIVPSWHGAYLARHIAGARYKEMDGNFHVPWSADQMVVAGDWISALEDFLLGGSAPAESERSLATVLFTDLVASTETAAQRGDTGWREILDAHDAAARREVGRTGGRVVKTTGDGCLATFQSPQNAIACALRLRETVQGLGLAARFGIHTGEVEHRGDDIGGIGVHIAARVESAAEPNEVLVSRTVRDLVAGSQVQFVDRGEFELKGIDEAWRLYAVAG